jgi:oxygen-independent coproporphyrinogen III oxidase
MVEMICKELELRKSYLPIGSSIKTIYFGGGTPSILDPLYLERILNQVYKFYNVQLEELTLEANPDDLKLEKLSAYKAMGVDRISLGIQSFDPEVLKFYNRAHTASESQAAIKIAQKAGFEKLSIDLIYGYPAASHQIWQNDLKLAFEQDPGHISSYSLTVEPKTVLGNWTKKGKFKEASEEFSAAQFEILMDEMEKHGYIQYEISNFAKQDQFALHNTNYWKAVPYLGIGPSAHSFDGSSRGANISNNALYIKSLLASTLPIEVDAESTSDIINAYILTSLRTIWGTDLDHIQAKSGVDLYSEKKALIDQLISEEMLQKNINVLILSNKGKLLADSIAAALFIE